MTTLRIQKKRVSKARSVRKSSALTSAIEGGVVTARGRLQPWNWQPDGYSQPVRCKAEDWLTVIAERSGEGQCPVAIRFSSPDGRTLQTVMEPESPGKEANRTGYSWVQAPRGATRVQIMPLGDGNGAELRRLELRPGTERDPKCHPLANLPGWQCYTSGFPIERIVLPESLAGLSGRIAHGEVRIVDTPRSLRKLAAHAVGAAIVIDPQWLSALRLSMSDIERVAAGSWMIIDLETLSGLVNRIGVQTSVATRTSRVGAMSARAEYADVPTRGLALQDVVPYGTFDDGRFSMRTLAATRQWKSYAERTGFALLMSSQTPVESHCNQIVACMRALGQGDLIATDLPWIAAGEQGTAAAPQMTQHLLEMLLGGPVDDAAQFWNRWDDLRVVVRDISDMARRYAPLRPIRWTSPGGGRATLGVEFTQRGSSPSKELIIDTGRIDRASAHDGLPPEPMMLFMRRLARRWNEREDWAVRILSGLRIRWRFESAAGLVYSPLFDAAEAETGQSMVVRLRTGDGWRTTTSRKGDAGPSITVPRSTGFLGDGSIQFQVELSRILNNWIENA